MKLKFDVTGSDPEKATGANFEPPPPGPYVARIDEITMGQSKKKDPMLTVVYEIGKGEHKGKKVWDRIVIIDTMQWKLDQFLQALGVATKKKRKGEVDLEELVGEAINIVVRQGEYNGNPTAEIARVSAVADEDDLEDDDDDDLEEDDELEEEDDDEVEDEDEDEDGEWDEDSLGELSKAELFEVAEGFELDTPAKFTAKAKASLIEAILEAQGGDEELEDEDEDEELEEDEEETDDDYESMSVAELRAELTSRELNSKGAKPALIARLRENDSEEEPF